MVVALFPFDNDCWIRYHLSSLTFTESTGYAESLPYLMMMTVREAVWW